MDGVMIPGRQVWKLRRETQHMADITEDIQKDELQLAEGQLESIQNEISQQFLSISATGVPADELAVGRAVPAVQAGQTTSSPSTSASSRLECPFALGIQALVLQETTPTDATTPRKKTAKTRGSATKGKSPQEPAGKSPPKATGGAPPKGPKASAGRPKVDREQLVTTMLASFKESLPDNPLFYGSEQAGNTRHMKRIYADLENMRKTASDEAEWESLTRLQKQVAASMAVIKQHNQSGSLNDAFGKVWDQQTHFLEMPPLCPDPFPVFLHRNRHSAKVLAASPQEFWRLASPGELQKLYSDGLEAAQLRHVADKVAAIAKAAGEYDAKSAILGLLQAMPEQYISQGSKLQIELNHLESIVDLDSASTDDLVAACKLFEDDSSAQIIASLASFPSGMALKDKAIARRDHGMRVASCCVHIDSLAKAAMENPTGVHHPFAFHAWKMKVLLDYIQACKDIIEDKKMLDQLSTTRVRLGSSCDHAFVFPNAPGSEDGDACGLCLSALKCQHVFNSNHQLRWRGRA